MYGDSSGTSGTEAKSEHAKVTYFYFSYNTFYAKLFLTSGCNCIFRRSNLNRPLRMSKKFLVHTRNQGRSPVLLWKQGKVLFQQCKTCIC